MTISKLGNISTHLMAESLKLSLCVKSASVCVECVAGMLAMTLTLGLLWSPAALNTGRRSAVCWSRREEVCVNPAEQFTSGQYTL